MARSTISRLVQRYNVTGSVKDRPRPGAQRITTRRQDVYIRLRHLRNRFLTASATARITVGNRGRPIHRLTVMNRLKAHGIRSRRPYKGIILRRRHRNVRLQWARQNVRNRNWRHVVFSDESRFYLLNSDGRCRVFRRQNERLSDNCIVEHDRFGGGSVMVWGAINYGFNSELIICQDNLNANSYINQILTPVVLPMFTQSQGLIFQPDNAPPHRARLTTNFLNQHNMQVLPWPAMSPDCNPIENLWDELGRRVRQRPQQPRNVNELALALRQEWNRIPLCVYRRLCQSMRSRLQEVIANQGGHTRY